MKNTAESTKPSPDDILNELRALVAEAEKILNQGSSDDSPGVENDLAALRERFEAARDRLTDAAEGVRQKVRTGARQADDAIRENPYQAMAIAAGVGLVLGMLLNRRKN